MTKSSDVNGVLVVDKPSGMTSHDVVDRVRRLFRTRRVGHTGTLDPDATGVLVLCLGAATRFADYLSGSRKHYVAEVTFGLETNTLDASGTVVRQQDASHLTDAAVCSLLPAFRGKILQTPPMVSARHHNGRRLYELARDGVVVERDAREIEIFSLELSGFIPAVHPTATLEITCSAGTYIRTLADDLGAAAKTGAMMQNLRRTWVGKCESTAFTLQEARSFEQLEALAEASTPEAALLPLASALRDATVHRLTPEGLRRLSHGQLIPLAEVVETRCASAVDDKNLEVVMDDSGNVRAVVMLQTDVLRPVKVLTQQ